MSLMFEGCQPPVEFRSACKRPASMAAHSISTLAIRDCRIRLMRAGAGAPLVFLHGGGGLGIWLPCIAQLAKKFDVITPQHPGLRESDTPAWLDTVRSLAHIPPPDRRRRHPRRWSRAGRYLSDQRGAAHPRPVLRSGARGSRHCRIGAAGARGCRAQEPYDDGEAVVATAQP